MTPKATSLRPAPPLLLGCGLILWGWQTGFFVYAIPMALLLELPNWIKWRSSFSDKEFNVVSDVSGLIFFVLVVYIFSKEGAGGIYQILATLPFILYLLVLIQQYSVQGKIKLSVLFISLRRLEPGADSDMNREVDISLPYFLICIISASSGNQYPILFFLIICLLFTVILISIRPKRYHPAVWMSLLVLSFSIGYASQMGIRQIQYSVELMMMEIFEKYMWRYRDPDRASTAIGSLGRLKLSDRILLRVDTDRQLSKPLLLHEASYSNYGYGVWSNVESDFQLIDPDITGKSWTLQSESGANNIAISTYKIKEISVVPLPYGTTNIYDITAFEVDRNNYGAIKMETKEGWIRYKAKYKNNKVYMSSPDQDDLFIPERHQPDFQRLVNEWKLKGKTPVEIADTVRRNFSENFYYSLEHRNRYPRGQYLHHFLFDNRSGHCEFFATSTVLLLRAAGIPARYAVGYAVNEYSRLEDRYIVRARDAHSWALAYLDGGWRVIDTTPAAWMPLAEENSSALEPVFDVIAWLKFRLSRWHAEDEFEDDGTGSDFLLWLLFPLLGFLLWRLYNRKRIGSGKAEDTDTPEFNHPVPGSDSALYQLIMRLEEKGYFRRPGETLSAWFGRISNETNNFTPEQALELHYRYRFDPAVDKGYIHSHLSQSVADIVDSDWPDGVWPTRRGEQRHY